MSGSDRPAFKWGSSPWPLCLAVVLFCCSVCGLTHRAHFKFPSYDPFRIYQRGIVRQEIHTKPSRVRGRRNIVPISNTADEIDLYSPLRISLDLIGSGRQWLSLLFAVQSREHSQPERRNICHITGSLCHLSHLWTNTVSDDYIRWSEDIEGNGPPGISELQTYEGFKVKSALVGIESQRLQNLYWISAKTNPCAFLSLKQGGLNFSRICRTMSGIGRVFRGLGSICLSDHALIQTSEATEGNHDSPDSDTHQCPLTPQVPPIKGSFLGAPLIRLGVWIGWRSFLLLDEEHPTFWGYALFWFSLGLMLCGWFILLPCLVH